MHRPHIDPTILHHLAAAAPTVPLPCEVVHRLIAWVLPAAAWVMLQRLSLRHVCALHLCDIWPAVAGQALR